MKKQNEISLINIVLCLLVIFIHVASAPVSSLIKDSIQYAVIFIPWRMSAFVVQGFIFLSGLKMFLKPHNNVNYGIYYFSRFKKIVVPYILIVCLFYIYFIIHGYFGFKLSELLKYIAKGDLVSHFYFVIVIVQFYLLRPLWEKIIYKLKPLPVIVISLVLTILFDLKMPDIIRFISGGFEFKYNDRVLTTYIIYWILGCYCGKYYKSFKKLIYKYAAGVVLFFAAMFIFDASVSLIHFSGRANIIWLEYVHIFYCLSAILFFNLLSVRLGNRVMSLTVSNIIDKSSYYIYLIHPLFIFITNDYIHRFEIKSTVLAFIIRSLFTYIGSIFICGLYTFAKGSVIKKNYKNTSVGA